MAPRPPKKHAPAWVTRDLSRLCPHTLRWVADILEEEAAGCQQAIKSGLESHLDKTILVDRRRRLSHWVRRFRIRASGIEKDRAL